MRKGDSHVRNHAFKERERVMSSADFIFLDGYENTEFDIQAFCAALRDRYPGVTVRERNAPEKAYRLLWDYQSSEVTVEGALNQKNDVFVINYFDSKNRLQDYAAYILWLRKWFPSDQEVVFCDEGYTKIFPLPHDISTKEIEMRLHNEEKK